MPSFSERVALFRIQQYLAKYRPYVATIAGTYGRTIAAQALYHAISRHRHARIGFGLETEKNIGLPAGQAGLLKFLVGSKMHELAEIEPDTIISTIPLEYPGYASYVLSRILPRLLVISHIGLEHVDLFGSKDIIQHEYLAVANTLERDAAVVLNADDEHVRELQQHINHPVITYGMHSSADVRLLRAKRPARRVGGSGDTQGIFMEFVLHGVHYEAHLPHLVSRQHVSGVLAGLAGAHAMGVDMHDAIAGVKQLTSPHGSFSIAHGLKGSIIIDDTADACPEKLESSLKSFSSMYKDTRKFVVLGDLDNLAQFAMKAHEELGKHAASVAPILIFVGDTMRHAQSAALKTGIKIDTHHFTTSADAAAWLPDHIRKDDIIYISGGKSMQMGKILRRLKKQY